MTPSSWWDIASLRSRLGDEAGAAKLLGHWFGPDRKSPRLAFLAADVSRSHSGSDVKRSLISAGPDLLVRFGAGAPLPAHSAAIEVVREKNFSIDLVASGEVPRWERITSVDLDGVRFGNRVLLFHNEGVSARSAVAFDLPPATETAAILVTGLAPGEWQVWRNGWLEDISGLVSPAAGALYFERPAGSFFLRRLG